MKRTTALLKNSDFKNPLFLKNEISYPLSPDLTTCMKTIRTAAYAAVAATTSNDLFGIVNNIDVVNRHINPVITPSFRVLLSI